MIYLGLPQWSHPGWSRMGFGIRNLSDYARYFNCVEGDTTLYAVPGPEVVQRWRAQTHDRFRFCFKFPATISHQAALRDSDDLVKAFLDRMAPLADRIGQFWLQLPARFSPVDLPALWAFLDALPSQYHYGVEVRHPAFFCRDEEERAFNRGLHQRGVNRVILDSRPVHSVAATNVHFAQARRQKPKVPVHALLTANDPMIRFVTSADMTANGALFVHWVARLKVWQLSATPWLFLHTPDMRLVASLIETLRPLLCEACPELSQMPALPHQMPLW